MTMEPNPIPGSSRREGIAGSGRFGGFIMCCAGGLPIWTSKLPRALVMASSTLAIALLFSLCLTCVGAAVDTVYHSHNSDRDLAERKVQCYKDIDSGLWGDPCKASPIDKENCALACVSASCYDSVYGNDPLEEGEIDLRRGRQFKACIRGQSKFEEVARVRGSSIS